MLDRLPQLVNADAVLRHRGRGLKTTFLVAVGAQEWLLHIDDGQVARVEKGPFRMPAYSFALRGGEEGWARFWQAVPPPYYQDLFGLMRQGELRAEGDLRQFWARIMYVKGVLGALRGQAGAA